MKGMKFLHITIHSDTLLLLLIIVHQFKKDRKFEISLMFEIIVFSSVYPLR